MISRGVNTHYLLCVCCGADTHGGGCILGDCCIGGDNGGFQPMNGTAVSCSNDINVGCGCDSFFCCLNMVANWLSLLWRVSKIEKGEGVCGVQSAKVRLFAEMIVALFGDGPGITVCLGMNDTILDTQWAFLLEK